MKIIESMQVNVAGRFVSKTVSPYSSDHLKGRHLTRLYRKLVVPHTREKG